MKKSLVINIIRLVLNTLIFGLGVFSLLNLFKLLDSVNIFRIVFVWTISIFALGGVVFNTFSLFKKKEILSKWWDILLFIVSSIAAFELLAILSIYGPKNNFNDLFSGRCYLSRILIDLLFIINYLAFKKRTSFSFWYTLLSIIPVFVFGVIYAICYSTRNMSDILNLNVNNLLILHLALLCVVIFLLSVFIWGIKRFFLIFKLKDEGFSKKCIDSKTKNMENEIKETIESEAFKTHEDKKMKEKVIKKLAVEEKAPVKEKSKVSKKVNSKYKDTARVYHISKYNSLGNKWQVKLATGEKAIKTFDTQLEAINFAKELVKTQGGSIRIHSVKGKLRK